MLSTTALRYVMGRKVRDIIMDRSRPFRVVDRYQWQLVANHWRSSHRMTWEEVEAAAVALRRDPRCPRGEQEARTEYARRLRAIGSKRPSLTPAEIRRRALARGAREYARARICPRCGGPFPCRPCLSDEPDAQTI